MQLNFVLYNKHQWKFYILNMLNCWLMAPQKEIQHKYLILDTVYLTFIKTTNLLKNNIK